MEDLINEEEGVFVVNKQAFLKMLERELEMDPVILLQFCNEMIHLVTGKLIYKKVNQKWPVVKEPSENATLPVFPLVQSNNSSWWNVFTSKLKQDHKKVKVGQDQVEYLFNVEHQVWHLSTEDPLVVKERFGPVEPPSTTPLVTSCKRGDRYVDNLGITAVEKNKE